MCCSSWLISIYFEELDTSKGIFVAPVSGSYLVTAAVRKSSKKRGKKNQGYWVGMQGLKQVHRDMKIGRVSVVNIMM